MRSRNRHIYHLVHCHTTRMLAGIPRPPPPDYLAIYCRCIRRIIEIDKSLKPFMREQQRIQENQLFHLECQAALAKVYGPPDH